MLGDDELIDELRREFTAATAGLQPRAKTLQRVRQEIARLSAEAPEDLSGAVARRQDRFHRRRWLPSAGVLSGAAAAAVAIAVVVIVVAPLHGARHGRGVQGTAEPPALAVGRAQTVAHAVDPGGRAGWALRETRTGPRSGCLRLGRTVNGRFLPMPARQDAEHCAQTDATGHLFLDLQLQDDLIPGTGWRSLYYGVLGPDAVSVTYRSGSGKPVTIPTGPDGGYLIVQRATCPQNDLEGDACEIGGSSRSRQLIGGAITKVTYRNGTTCQLRFLPPGQRSTQRCGNLGFASAPPRKVLQIAPGKARAHIKVNAVVTARICYKPTAPPGSNDRPCGHRIPRGYRLQEGPAQRTLLISLQFIAPLAADNHQRVYEWSLGRASGPHCAVGGGGVSATTMTPIRKGAHVLLQDQESPCPGTYTGLITWTPDGHPGNDRLTWDTPIRDGSLLVGRFRFTVR